ncbi:hypothetical protein ACOACO_15020 [Nocardioides sp. CPCC 205120]|uniref:hypothetical protein n=1 Tax=Nocardioides sp. CPCC 205120 TaxID=3406462 RepID=UPI003B510A11
MTVHLEPGSVRAGWQHGAAAGAELDAARGSTGAAGGPATGPFQATLAYAAGEVDGALATGSAVVAELGANVEACIADFVASDGASAGAFNELGDDQ